MSLSDRIIRNVFFGWAYYFISIVVGIFLMPFMIHRLGDSTYGIWILILSLCGYMGLFDIGIRNSIVKYVAQMHAKKEKEKLNELVSTSFVTCSFLGVLVFCVAIVIAAYFNKFFHINAAFVNEARLVVLLLGLNMALGFPLAVFGGVIWGLQRHDIFSAIQTFIFIIRTVLIVVFIGLGFRLVALGVITLITNLIGSGLRTYYAWRLNPDLRINYRLFKRPTLKLILNYGLFIFLISIATRVISYTDSIVIGLFMTATAITYYAIAFRLIDYSWQFINITTSVLVPTTSAFDANREFAKIRKLLILGTKYSMMLTIPIAITFIIFGKPLIHLWIGSQYTLSAQILIILTIPHLLAFSQHIAKVILEGIGKLKVLTSLTICEALANLIISVLLVKPLGLVGVALGTAIPFVIIKAFILPVYVCRVVRQPFSEYIKKSAMLPFVSIVPLVFLGLFLKNILYPESVVILVSEAAIYFVLYAFVAVKLCMDKNEVRFVWQTLKGLVFRPLDS